MEVIQGLASQERRAGVGREEGQGLACSLVATFTVLCWLGGGGGGECVCLCVFNNIINSVWCD